MIVMSPGHWKIGSGATGYIDEVTEARKVVQRVSEILKHSKLEHTVILDNQSQNQRENLAYLIKEHRKYSQAQHISIHFNSSNGTSKEAIGCEVLYAGEGMKALAQKMSQAVSEAGGFKNRGAKFRNELKLLNTFAHSLILIEVCFVNSKEDVELYKKNFEAICISIAQACSSHQIGTNISSVSAGELRFTYTAIEQKVEAIFSKQSNINQLIQYGIGTKAIQDVWKNRYPKDMTKQDVLGLALLIACKQMNKI